MLFSLFLAVFDVVSAYYFVFFIKEIVNQNRFIQHIYQYSSMSEDRRFHRNRRRIMVLCLTYLIVLSSTRIFFLLDRQQWSFYLSSLFLIILGEPLYFSFKSGQWIKFFSFALGWVAIAAVLHRLY